jgi:hypothetical protein
MWDSKQVRQLMLKKKWRSEWLKDVNPAKRPAIVADHQHHRHQLARKRDRPFAGAYYWIPFKANEWSVLVFPNAFYEGGEAGHVHVWEEVVHILAYLHQLSGPVLLEQIGNYPYGLPRGRAVRMGDGNWGVAHGGDHPEGTDLESCITEAFLLKDVRPKFFFDEHEQMLPGDRHHVGLSITSGLN